ncbi:MAG: OmpA family protein [Bacteroidetes bacterium]|nr:OmpA family protein [Bacteroidota bacterium]
MKKNNGFLLMLVAIMVSASLFAQRKTDVENSKDYPLVSRFEGAVIEYYKETKWGTYKVPVDDKGKITFSAPRILEGKVVRIQYSVPADNNPEFVLQNYKAAFIKAGFSIITAVSNEGLGVGTRSQDWDSKYYGSGDAYWTHALNNGKFGLQYEIPAWKGNQAFLVANAQKGGKDIFITVYSVDHNTFTLINQDVIEVEAAQTGMVTAENISKGIIADGHIAIYDILFETGKSEIKPESANAIKTIADYIKANTGKKFYIVGHTDNTGNFPDNMSLSENRAKAVMSQLTAMYAVNPGQLVAHGVASLSPVASNSTEEGKAKNRRVEIVEQ